ncbi:MAG: helix-turn-helix domain-containing protein [Gammaproteobacteria bacterium]|nr:MAG: helix-turn-helix domain-containing protein [Gammaproteobacteria bacterium]
MSSHLNKKVGSMDIGLLASNLCCLMHEFNVDSSSLSAKTGIALTTINSLKRGAGNPTLSTLYQLAEFFDVSIGQLTEANLSADAKKSRVVYEIPLLNLDELSDFLRNKNRYKNTISTELESWRSDKFYAIKINNHAMSPLFDKGSIFVIAHDTQVHDGDIVLVQFGKNPPCFRKVFIEEKCYFFKPISEIIGDNTIKSNDFTIHGMVIKAIQHFHD